MNVLDLFCGCGGFTKGLIDSGLNVVAGIDKWDKACDNYRQNYKHICLCKDLEVYHPSDFVEETGIKNIGIIVGGPPCQGFSIAGKRDVLDPRNNLINVFIEYVQYFKPDVFCMENVYGILSMKFKNGQPVVDTIISSLQEYNISVNKLSAQWFEVPQNRKRVIIVGFKNTTNIISSGIKPYGNTIIPVKDVLEDRCNVQQKYYLSAKAIAGIHNKKQRSKELGNGFGAQFLDLDKPSYTIPARYYKDGYDALVKYDEEHIRRLTITELKRIQTFGDDYILTGTKKDIIMQIGNAIPCKLAYHIGLFIQSELLKENKINQSKMNKSIDPQREIIVNMFNKNVKGKKFTKISTHCGSEGHWLEEQFGVKHNNHNEPDIYGYELKKESQRITFGDFGASEYLFSKKKKYLDYYNNNLSVTRTEFMKYFGSFNVVKQRYSWSGKCMPKYNIWNEYGQKFICNEHDDLLIVYNSKYDHKHQNIPDILVNKNIVIAIWTRDKLYRHVNNKFNQKGFIICRKDNNNVYTNIYFGKSLTYEMFMQYFKEGSIFLDSGMYDGNNRNYSQFRANKSFWEKLLE